MVDNVTVMDRRNISLVPRKPFISRKHFAFLIGTTVACLFTIISVLQSNQSDLRTLEERLPHPLSLTENVRVLCWVMTTPANHETKALHVKRTWGRRCNKLLLMSSTEDEKVGTVALPVGEGRQHLWNKTREAFRYVYEHHLNEYDWFMKADDDTYVIVENLRYFLYPYSPEFPIYFGSKFRYPEYVSQGYFSGGAGYVLSREALKRFIEQALDDSAHCSTAYETEDLEMGKCMESVNVTAGDSRDFFGRKRFLPMEPVFHLTSNPAEDPNFWYNYYSFYEPFYGENCCSDLAISFHYVGGQQMYAMDYMIYGLHPYGIRYNNPELPPKKNWEEAMIVAGPYPATTTPKSTTLADDSTTAEINTEVSDDTSRYPENSSESTNTQTNDLGISQPYNTVTTGLEQTFESSSVSDKSERTAIQNV
ncbi:glycoprotein-N-acetylgalactosamine 3-beta-galactosyltransferase 1-like isoform X2 [Toxorhynchites rutilus septentrionalis]|uniref:glycoprotein-N-acetylgalactosamine 3-beta-galactosyltransferase 1-like isoform X2 n=1 Tax=Toxorhynchites rutilus septentrionalis TaxID=329112 RepID=UPI00247A0DA4|nr:glycoprotein-N-acetylgalactosamine 3-beta-galactosyltransferase 1-like isoform X2 [Toxorhynchites rutilus septentrionalis]